MRVYSRYKKVGYRGVTLFEVLTAIIIFTTGILVLLSMIGSNITRMRTIRLKDDATMLAKEAIEMIYHMRDSNLEKGLLWYCGEFDNTEGDKCGFDIYTSGTGVQYTIDWVVTGAIAGNDDIIYQLIPYTSPDDTRLYLHDQTITLSGSNQDLTRYNHKSNGGTSTPYSRYITITPVDDYISSTDKILQVEVHVIADQGIREYEVVLESLIGDTR